MGFLDNFTTKTTLPDTWNELTSLADLEEAHELSFKKPVVFFKHSVTCGISAGALHRIENVEAGEAFAFYYLDLKAYREVSNAIAAKYGVIHQSPQIIVIRDGKAVFDTSHHNINQAQLLQIVGG